MNLLPQVGLPTQHPYLSNKYTQWYYNIITHAINRDEIVVITEIHHIIPRSMGGSNDPHNLVKLTPREHFLVHLLLVRMTDRDNYFKMVNAVWYMTNSRHKEERRAMSARLFQNLREVVIAFKKQKQTGIKLSDETRAKQSASHKGKVKSPEHLAKLAASQKGKKLSPESIAKRTATRRARGNYAHSEAHKAALRGRKQTPESNEKRSRSLTGKKMSAESNQKRSLAMTGRKKDRSAVIKAIETKKANGTHRRTPESIAKGLATKAAKKLLSQQTS